MSQTQARCLNDPNVHQEVVKRGRYCAKLPNGVPRKYELTDRDKTIIRMVADGYTRENIAATFYRSNRWAQWAIHRIYLHAEIPPSKDYNPTTRKVALVRWAIRNKIIEA
jgi:DNA-binding NarL/FixJ family response regulator